MRERIFQVQSWYKSRETGQEAKLQMTPYRRASRSRQNFPQIEQEVYVTDNGPVFFRNGEATSTEDYLWVDGNLPRRRAAAAGPRRPLRAAPGQHRVLTQSEARRRFGTDNVVGQTMTLITRGVARLPHHRRARAICRSNSHFAINSLIRLDLVAYNADSPDALDCWGCQNGWVYVKLRPGADVDAIRAGLQAWEAASSPTRMPARPRFNAGDDQDWHMVNVADVHLGEAQAAAMAPGNDRTTIITFAIVALLILGMAVVNFTNLATARASQRAREVALRKALGATRRQLIVQFVGESILVAVVAMLIALALVELLLPRFRRFLEADLAVDLFRRRTASLLPVLVLVLVVGVARRPLSGLLPVALPAGLGAQGEQIARPRRRARAGCAACSSSPSSRSRSALIICTAVIYGQTVYARTVDPGYNRSHILQIDELPAASCSTRARCSPSEMRRVPGVVGGRADHDRRRHRQQQQYRRHGARAGPSRSTIGIYQVDDGFFEAMGIELVAGRWFDEQPADGRHDACPTRRTTRRSGRSPRAAATSSSTSWRPGGSASAIPPTRSGKTFRAALVDERISGSCRSRIIGVVRDSRFRSVSCRSIRSCSQRPTAATPT